MQGVNAREELFAGEGEMAGLMREFAWQESPLGPPEAWPQSLRTAVSICLGSRFPIVLWWGRELRLLYNDAWRPALGVLKHPAIAKPGREVWSEIWHLIGPMLNGVLETGRATWSEDMLLPMDRYGYLEETYWTYSYSPIRVEDGSVGGVFTAVSETTERVLAERRLQVLGALGALAGRAETAEGASGLIVETLAGFPDLPCSAILFADAQRPIASSFNRTERLPPAVAAAVAAAFEGRTAEIDELPSELVDGVGFGDRTASHAAVVLPLRTAGRDRVVGALLAALNAERALDEGYRSFLGLVAEHAERLIGGAQALEEERRRAEELAELDRAKTTFFSNVSHELRTPLTLILGPVEEALQEDDLRPEQRKRAEVVRRNALRLLRMVNTLLDFARVESQRLRAQFRPTDLELLTRELVGAFAPVIDRAGLRLDAELEPLPQEVFVDPDAWEKVVLNLLSNAFKFTREGEIRVALRAQDGEVLLTVADSGTGIPADELPRLFERFHRVRNDAARTHEGTGIGLALVHEFVGLHQGRVAVESEPGRGTTFTVALPLGHEHLPADQVEHSRFDGSAAGTAVPYVEEASRWLGVDDGDADVLRDEEGEIADGSAGEGERIVVVDDNADMRDYLVRLLEPHWAVTAYPDGAAALAAIRAEPPAIVISDVMMPRLDGFGLVASLRRESATSAVPVILVSARAGEESSVEGLESGADDYLVKPFSARELLARVRMNLELAKLRVEFGRLSALEEVRSRVITTVSHELRTPVSAIYGAAKTLDRAALIDETTQRELLGVIAGQSERLARVTGDILTAEGLASGVLTLALESVNAAAAVAEAVAAATVTSDRPSFRTAVPERSVPVHADRGRLQQVLANLLDNAIKYSPDGSGVDISVEEDGDQVRIVVADAGVGVAAAEREQIFQRFYRSDPELTGGVGGSGLGLYICRELTEAMGGRIWVEPNAPTGSRFIVALSRP